MKGIIIYKSKYGAAKKYAGWLNEATGYEAVSVEKADVNTLSDYDVIILGGGVYAHGIAIVPFLKKNLGRLKGKKIIVYTCGASPYDEKLFNELVDLRSLHAFEVISYGHVEYESVRITESKFF